MDRATLLQRANSHKGAAVIARSEGRLLDALFEECMYFHFDRLAKGTSDNGLSIQAMLILGMPLFQLRFSTETRKAFTSAVIAWSKEGGEEEKLKELIDKYNEGKNDKRTWHA